MTSSPASSNHLQDPKKIGAFSKCPTLGIGDILGDQTRNKFSRNQSHVAPAFCVPMSSLIISFPILSIPRIVGTQSRTHQTLGKVHGAKQGYECRSEDGRERSPRGPPGTAKNSKGKHCHDLGRRLSLQTSASLSVRIPNRKETFFFVCLSVVRLDFIMQSGWAQP